MMISVMMVMVIMMRVLMRILMRVSMLVPMIMIMGDDNSNNKNHHSIKLNNPIAVHNS